MTSRLTQPSPVAREFWQHTVRQVLLEFPARAALQRGTQVFSHADRIVRMARQYIRPQGMPLTRANQSFCIKRFVDRGVTLLHVTVHRDQNVRISRA